MSSALRRYEKRISNEFEFNGEKYKVRGLTNGEIERADKVERDLKNPLFYGFGMLDETGQQIFTQAADETDAAFAARVKSEMANVPLPTMGRVIDEIVKTTMPPKDMDNFIKNSEATAT